MKLLKRAAALACAALVISASGCKNSGSGGSGESSQQSGESHAAENENIQLKSYAFPEFLLSVGSADMMSNVVYKSFDSAAAMSEPESQPFEDYKCTACFAENYYIFTDEEGSGIINAYGTELLPSRGVEKITASAADLLRIRYEDGTNEYFRIDGEGGGEIVVVGEFDKSRVGFSRVIMSDEQEEYFLQLDGMDIYDTAWSSAEEIDIETLDTTKKYRAVYKTSTGSASYYIAFDSFYNFTVYEAAYGFISLKIGGEYGECYILNGKDYSELETLISSFGRESRSEAPSRDESADYIQITLGIDSGVIRKMSVSADGYCFTENTSADSETADDKFFTVMDPETFVDLINWVDSTLKTEYN